MVDEDADPEAAYLKSLNDLNSMACSILDTAGYNSKSLQIKLTSFSSKKRQDAILKPRTRERQDAIAKVKVGGGKHFQLTGGAALNEDDYFISLQRSALQSELESLEQQKRKKQESEKRETDALALLQANENRGDDKWNSKELKTLLSWKMEGPVPTKLSTKPNRLAKWMALKAKVVPPAARWTTQDQAELERLKHKIDHITLEDTELGRQRQRMQLEALSTVRGMSESERDEFLRSLANGRSSDNDGDSVVSDRGGSGNNRV
ncbi:unknown protein [Seminavis robusta]|uniref:Uncharacterized protein n=1 Tax=Seminavis robusta TaxID=568900 RepID=A0A9N8HY91_9STRA|nr:unknown protein [Seminavis robusta]|eukprot:Sro3777_g350970.1 n/a (263) ;mRNA; r:1850-2638